MLYLVRGDYTYKLTEYPYLTLRFNKFFFFARILVYIMILFTYVHLSRNLPTHTFIPDWMVYANFFIKKLYFFVSNLNVECFQLSFNIHIVHVSQKLRILKNRCTESEQISAVKVGYFGATLWQNYATYRMVFKGSTGT